MMGTLLALLVRAASSDIVIETVDLLTIAGFFLWRSDVVFPQEKHASLNIWLNSVDVPEVDWLGQLFALLIILRLFFKERAFPLPKWGNEEDFNFQESQKLSLYIETIFKISRTNIQSLLYNRYFRILYLNEYSNKVHVWKVNMAVLMAFNVAVLHGTVQTASISYNFYSEVSLVLR